MTARQVYDQIYTTYLQARQFWMENRSASEADRKLWPSHVRIEFEMFSLDGVGWIHSSVKRLGLKHGPEAHGKKLQELEDLGMIVRDVSGRFTRPAEILG